MGDVPRRGLEGGRFAILSKTHHAMVDGISAVDIGQVILDVDPEPRKISSDEWRPSRESHLASS